MGFATSSPAPSLGTWRVADTASDLFGMSIPDEAANNPACLEVRDSVGLACVDEEWTLVELVKEADRMEGEEVDGSRPRSSCQLHEARQQGKPEHHRGRGDWELAGRRQAASRHTLAWTFSVAGVLRGPASVRADFGGSRPNGVRRVGYPSGGWQRDSIPPSPRSHV